MENTASSHPIVRAAVLVAITLAAGTALAEEQSRPDQLIAQWQEQNSLCRGLHGDDPRMQPACDERQRLGRALDTQGWCYSKKGQMGYQMQWHKCGPDSEHYE